MSAPVAVDVIDVSKRFKLSHEKYQSLKEKVLHAGRNPYDVFWALRDVRFDVTEGETVGMLGRNGSGKSTLLKCVSGILQPTSGKVVVRGQLAALLELGAGFQSELSGRENIYLNASLLGLSTREVTRRFDEIVAFAELEQFIDNQVKYYSSGMYVRLGFAVAVNVDPDILVVDEVLAVGDENFQRKCLNRIKEFQAQGRTILFVTHAIELVRQICDRVVVLDAGQVLGVLSAGEGIGLYHDQLAQLSVTAATDTAAEQEEEPGPGFGRVRFLDVDLEHPGSGSRPYLLPGEGLTLKVAFDAVEAVQDVVFGISVHDVQGNLLFGTDTAIMGQRVDVPVGTGRVDFRVERAPLLEGAYTVSLDVTNSKGVLLDARERAAQFEMVNPGKARGTLALEVHAEVSSSVM